MFRKMLVCTDLSPASDALIQCVSELKTVGMEEAVLTHVIYVANTPGLEEKLAEEARPLIERQKEILEARGVKVAVEMPFGLPAHTLNETAEKHNVSAVLIGSHGKGILQTAVLGSVSAKLLHESRRPILLARLALLEGGKCQLVCRKLFHKILFPTDFSETSNRAFSYLEKVIEATKSRVTIMHVHDELSVKTASPEQLSEIENYATNLMEALIARLEVLGSIRVSSAMGSGNPSLEIVSMAKEGNCSLIIMGSQGKGLAREIVMGSVAKEIARHANVPVLFIPAQL